MKHVSAAGGTTGDCLFVQDRALDELKAIASPIGERCEIANVAAGKIVHYHDMATQVGQDFAHV